jgi:hypothetical protein
MNFDASDPTWDASSWVVEASSGKWKPLAIRFAIEATRGDWMRHITPDSTDQTLVFEAYDASADPVTLTFESAGLSLAYRIDADGREGTPVSLTPIARDVAGTHQDGAITSKGGGKHEVDVPDAAFAAANDGKTVTLVASATGVDLVVAEKVALGNVPSAEEISNRLERTDGPIDKVPKFDDTIQRDKTSASSSQMVETLTKVTE